MSKYFSNFFIIFLMALAAMPIKELSIRAKIALSSHLSGDQGGDGSVSRVIQN